jgi:hypothetical protein
MRHVEAEFREVVSEAVALLPGVGEHRTSDGALVLELPPDAETGAARYAVFRRLAKDDSVLLQRLALQEVSGELDVTYLKTYAPPFGVVAFGGDVATNLTRSVTLRLAPVDNGNPQRRPRERLVAATLGGMGGTS